MKLKSVALNYRCHSFKPNLLFSCARSCQKDLSFGFLLLRERLSETGCVYETARTPTQIISFHLQFELERGENKSVVQSQQYKLQQELYRPSLLNLIMGLAVSLHVL